ncbi:radical SAM protein [Streptomyces anulatus]|uniref:radical SAM protein n=1 Tax=Streptomyces anulatus TaxID=1892 RepID=UPI0004CB8E60|nr:radical SAM protein [Streptomyces anulatus]
MLRRQWPLFAATVEGQVLPPYEVLIHPSSGCNLRCQWCIGDHVPLEIWDDERDMLTLVDASKEAPDRLPDTLGSPVAMMKLVRDIVGYRKTGSYRSGGTDHTREFRVHNVSFSGLIGEPLISRAALMPAISYLIDNDVRVGIFTNGELMDNKVIDVLVHSGYVHVSLDAATGPTYAALKFRGHKAGAVKFERAVENLRALAARRRQERTDLEISVSFILYPENYHEVYDMAVLARDAGADRLRLKRDISGDKLLDPAQVAHANELIARIRDEVVDENFELIEVHKLDYEAELPRQFSVCSITDMFAAVGSDGHLYPCNYHPRPGGASYGSAVDTSFAEVWEGAVRARVRGDLPAICPKVCDPFKNRSNTMLQIGKTIIATHGLDHLERDVNQLIDARAYESAHGREHQG